MSGASEPPEKTAPLPTPTLALVGFMGAGKTRAGQAMAETLGEGFADTDAEIELELGGSVTEIFERDGEAAFREAEERVALRALERGGVVSLGGGAIISERVRKALGGRFTIWCDADLELCWQRAEGSERPLARDREGFRRLFAERRPLYEELARATLGGGGERSGRRAAHWIRAAAGLDGSRLAWAESASGSYPAIVARGAVGLLDAVGLSRPQRNGSPESAAPPLPRRWFCVGDRRALEHHAGLLPAVASTIEVTGAEASKTLAEAERVLRELTVAGALRDDGVLAFGGGVVGDLAGFCAATYQRGVPVVQAPTTLLAQVDSAYGGKTGVDLPEAKNYAGAYHQPLAVLADPVALETLPDSELAAGFAEVVKTALLAGGSLWERVRALERLQPGEIEGVIFDCARTKLGVVAADERDTGARAALNLGHTVGHAIETAAGYGRYRHGEAVALGLLAALRISGATDLRDEVRDLLGRIGLPATLDPSVQLDQVMEAMGRDKKRTGDGLGFVLLERPGAPLVGSRVPPVIVREAVEELY